MTVPPGKLPVTVTFLAMDARPDRTARAAPMPGLSLVRAEGCTTAFYRFLYDTVGGPWLWEYRRRMPQAELAAILADPAVAVVVLYANGTPAGYVEFDRRQAGVVDLAYFGLIPEFVGRGLGPWLLDWAVDRAWDDPATHRVTVNTCTFDHPAALSLYRRGGFDVVRREDRLVDDPRLTGLIPRHMAPHVPLATAPGEMR